MVEDRSDPGPDGFDAAFGGLSEQMFELCEDLLDRIEIGTIGRQEEEMRAGRSQGGAHGLTFVTAEIVEHDDIAWRERRDQDLFDVDAEAVAVDRAIEDPWRLDTIGPQGSEKGHGLPVSERDLGPQSLAFGRPASQRRHVGLGPGLVDEDQASGINPALVGLPPRSFARDIGPILLAGQHGFF